MMKVAITRQLHDRVSHGIREAIHTSMHYFGFGVKLASVNQTDYIHQGQTSAQRATVMIVHSKGNSLVFRT